MPSFRYQIIMKKIEWSVAVMAASLSWAHARNVKVNGETTCVGEAVSSRAISHGGLGDSGIGETGNDCYFSAESAIRRQIAKVCPIRDMNVSEVPGPKCRVKAVLHNRLIVYRSFHCAWDDPRWRVR